MPSFAKWLCASAILNWCKLAVINFSQVSSCGTATAVSVPCMLSGMSRQHYDEQLASHREGLLDIAQRAGYQVTWIDNFRL